MNRRQFLAAPLAAAPQPAAPLQQGRPAPPQRPNVIWFFGDQHRAQTLGISGDENVSTPNIDNLASMGVQFTQAVSGFPLCCPFRGSLLTGRYPHHAVPGHEYALPEGQPTVAQPFREAGGRNSRKATGSLTATWQFSCLPGCPQYCRATPTECLPFFEMPVSSKIQATIGCWRVMAGST
jgi:hypothetical protein